MAGAIGVRQQLRLSVRNAASDLWQPAALFLTPIVVFVVVRGQTTHQLQLAIGVVLGIGIIAALSRHPGFAVVSLVSGFGIAAVGQPLLLRLTHTPDLVRMSGYWKEAMLAALAAALWRSRREQKPLDNIDWAALLLVLIVTAYYLFPTQFPPDGIAVPGEARLIALRNIIVMPVALVLCRRLTLDDTWRRRAATGIILTGAVCGAAAVWEVTASGSFTSFFVNTLQVPKFDALVRGSARADLFSVSFGRTSVQRAGTLWRNPVLAGFAYLPPLAFALDRLAREGANAARVMAVGCIGVGLALTQTRSSMIGAVVVIGIVASRRGGLSMTTRVRLAIVLVIVGLSVAPFLAGTALVGRFTAAVQGSDQSTKNHKESSSAAYDLVKHHPLGRGLGSAGGISLRFGVQQRSIAENYYLQLATEAGVAATAAFAAMVLLSARRLLVTGPRTPVGITAAAAIIGLSVNAYFLHAFENPVASLPPFALLGVGLAATRDHRKEARP